MAIVEGYPNGVWNRLQDPVATTKDIVLTPHRHTYMFQGWKDKIINRLIAGGMFSVRSNDLDRFDMTGQAEMEELDRAYGWFDTPVEARVHRTMAAPGAGIHPTAATATVARRPSVTAAARGAHTAPKSAAPSPAVPAGASGFDKGIHLGVFTTFETIPGTFLPTTKSPALGAGFAKSVLLAAIPGGEVVESLKTAFETVERAHDVHELVERLHGGHVHDDGRNWGLLRRPIQHVEPKSISAAKNFLKTRTGMGEQKVIVVLSLLPGRNMLRIPCSSPVKLQIIANFLDSMDAVKG